MRQAPLFLVGSVNLTLHRRSMGEYQDYEWVESDSVELIRIKANVQPMRYQDTLLLPDGERSKKALRVYARCHIRSQKESIWEADRFEWQGDQYEVMKVLSYDMGVLNHRKAIACRIELTPDSVE